MKNRFLSLGLLSLVALLLTGCWGGRFVSADADLEAIYIGKSYYDIVADFGRPDASMNDGMEGSKIAYNSVSLSNSKASDLYQRFNMRNRATKVKGTPKGGITFSLNADMKCYAVDSDFEHERVKQPKQPKAAKPGDPRRPNPVKPKIPRTIDYPYFESCNTYAEKVSIEKVEIDRLQTKIYFTYRDRTPMTRPLNDIGLYIMPEIYIEDCATRVHYELRKAEGISLYPDRTEFAHNEGGYDVLVYSLTFAPLAESTEYINIVEPGHSGFNYYRVDVRTPITTKDELRFQK